VEPASVLILACSEGTGEPVALHIGEQNSKYSLQRLSQDQLFLSADTSEFPAGCSLQASLKNGRTTQSAPFTLAHIIRLPEIGSFDDSGQPSQDGKHTYTLTGRDLEMIEKVGWDQLEGVPVAGLPTPIQGQGQKQMLQVSLPDAVPQHATLYLWLRGQNAASATTLSPPGKSVISSPPPPSSGGPPSQTPPLH
jgi:hypothetical protein